MNGVLRKVLSVGAVCAWCACVFVFTSASGRTVPANSQATRGVTLAAASSTITEAQFVNPDNTTGDLYGVNLTISDDASTALIISFSPNSGVCYGVVYVYDHANGVWSTAPVKTLAAPPTATSPCYFGTGESLSTDGSTALIGSASDPNTGGNNSKAYVYVRTNNIWSDTPTATFSNPGTSNADCFACDAVALSSDGTTALIGAPGTKINSEDGAGKAYLYKQSNGVWSTTPVATFTPPTVTAYYNFGFRVALSADGAVALVGSSPHRDAGAAYVYEATNGAWSSAPTPAATINDPRDLIDGSFGGSLALSSDGSTALIGEWDPAPSGATGVVYVYYASGGIWSTTPAAEFDDPEDSLSDSFGSALSLSSHGNTALIEGTHHLNRSSGPICCGLAYVYTKTNGLWGLRATATLQEPNAKDSPYNVYFGASLALSSDGKIALIGDPQTPNLTPPAPSTVPQYGGPGTAYAFETTGSWKQSSSGGGKSGGGALAVWALAGLLVLLVFRRRGIRLN